jgi:hypothetical protein
MVMIENVQEEFCQIEDAYSNGGYSYDSAERRRTREILQLLDSAHRQLTVGICSSDLKEQPND